jgi:hypothetical protein
MRPVLNTSKGRMVLALTLFSIFAQAAKTLYEYILTEEYINVSSPYHHHSFSNQVVNLF